MKKFGLILIFAFTTFFSSCEKDLYEETIAQEKIKIGAKLSTISLSEIPEIGNEIKNVRARIKKNKPNGSLHRSIDELNLDEDKVIELLLDNGYKSYSFIINKDYDYTDSYYLENLNIITKENGYDALITKFIPDNGEYFDDMKKFTGEIQYIDLSEKIIKSISVENGNFVALRFITIEANGCSYVVYENQTLGIFEIISENCSGSSSSTTTYTGSFYTSGIGTAGTGGGPVNYSGYSNTVITTTNIPGWTDTASQNQMSINITNRLNLGGAKRAWLNNIANYEVTNKLYSYLLSNTTIQANSFSSYVIDELFNDNDNIELRNSALITLDLLINNQLQNIGSEEATNIIQSYITSIDPTVTAGFMIKYNTHVISEMALIMQTYPDGYQFSTWEIAKICMEANTEALHLGLDIAGMAPGVGALFDVTNGIWYTVSGDIPSGIVSFVGAIPFAGDWSTVARITKRVYIYGNDGRKVILKAYKLADGTIKFSNRGQLRKVLGLTNSALHAHHVIPYGLANNPVVQKAAKYSSSIKKAWHPNDIANGIGIPADFHLTGHAAYQTKIEQKLELLNTQAGDNIELAWDLLTNYTAEVKNIIAANPDKTLGEIALLLP